MEEMENVTGAGVDAGVGAEVTEKKGGKKKKHVGLIILIAILVVILVGVLILFIRLRKPVADSPSQSTSTAHVIKENLINTVVVDVLGEDVESFWDLSAGGDTTLGDMYKSLNDDDQERVDGLIDKYISTDTVKALTSEIKDNGFNQSQMMDFVMEKVVSEEDKAFVADLIAKYAETMTLGE